VGLAIGRAHPSTLHRYESSLDPHETRLARVRTLRVDAPSKAGAETHCRLSLQLIDAETKKPLPGLVRIAPPRGAALELPGLMNRGLKLRTGNEYTQESLARLSSDRMLFGNGEEHRNNIGRGGEGFGHVLFLDLPQLVQPVSIGPGITGAGPDYPPLSRGIDRAREQGATIVWCHNGFGFEHIPAWLSGRVHALNIFDGGTQGSYVQTFYRFLNVGLRVPFSTGTDWFIYDFSRVYVQLSEPLSVASWRRGLADGRTMITNGPLLEFQAAGRSVGDTIALGAPGRVPLSARATGRIDFKGLELVHDGRVVASAPSRRVGGHYVAEVKFPLAVEQSGWVAARIPGGTIDGDGFAAFPAGGTACRLPRRHRTAATAAVGNLLTLR